ncbi:hypothetical protein KVR01_009588 [Diaporthe batatas]|uniref:uncharacterized protein n=1 Tax=Diaporthe batatas TaxID=748121 RepID=UPI001D03A55C|nr:uncharacterized protein KVR01_009588 [Diaporthe batatas]KAG8161324.1 hypothetical protein KVR01_009588 [Diaporthe batatas]
MDLFVQPRAAGFLPGPNESSYSIAATTTSLILATAFVAVRFWARNVRGAACGADDWVLLSALLMVYVVGGFNYGEVSHGLGRMAVHVPLHQQAQLSKTLFAMEFAYVTTIVLIKLSILLMYIRIFPRERKLRITAYIVAAVVVAWGIALYFVFLFQCSPVRKAWTPSVEGHCIEYNWIQIGNAVPNIITDVVILCMPIPLVLKLHITVYQKFALCLTFSLGAFVLGASIYRFTVLFHYDPKNPTCKPSNTALEQACWMSVSNSCKGTLLKPCTWCVIEVSSGVISACLPTFGPLLFRAVHAITERNKSSQKPSRDIVTIGGSGRGFGGGSEHQRSRQRFGKLDSDVEEFGLGNIQVTTEYRVDAANAPVGALNGRGFCLELEPRHRQIFPLADMPSVRFFISGTLCHRDEDRHELDLYVRHNGRLFFLEYHTDYFVRSPAIRATYLKYLQEIRDDEVYWNDPDPLGWLLKPFEDLILKLAPPVSRTQPPTLSQYAFPEFFSCRLYSEDEKFYPKQLDKWKAWTGPPGLEISKDLFQGLQSWTRAYDPSEVILCYDRSEDVLAKPPRRVQLSNGPGEDNSSYFLKSFIDHGARYQLQRELATFKQITESKINPAAHITRLRGVVTSKDGRVLGLLLNWIDDPVGSLAYQYWRRSLQSRLQWAAQIRQTISELHKNGVVWGDAKLENILLDRSDTPWIIDFGGGCTPNWVDRNKAETLEGDLQGLEKIVETLSRPTPANSVSSATNSK